MRGQGWKRTVFPAPGILHLASFIALIDRDGNPPRYSQRTDVLRRPALAQPAMPAPTRMSVVGSGTPAPLPPVT